MAGQNNSFRSILGLGLIIACQPASLPAAAPAAQSASQPASPPASGLILPQGTRVEIEFLSSLSSTSCHRGDRFAFRLASPITYRGAIIVPAGTPGEGEVIEAKPAKGSGVPGVLILSAGELRHGGQIIPLRRLQQDSVGEDRVGRENGSVWASRFAVLPTSLLAMTQTGGNVMVAQGGKALAQVAKDTPVLPPPPGALAASARQPIQPLPANAELSVPAPPAGKGQVVFFRPASLYWSGIGCTVSEDGHKISSLGSGKWFAVLAAPGIHAYTVTGETKDSLRLPVEEGETLFVGCRMRAGVLVARPTIRPVDSRVFHSQLADLKPVHDGDMADPAVLRRDMIRYALAERGDVRGASPNGASRGDTTGSTTLDRPTQTTLGAAAAAMARRAGVGIQ